MYSSDAPGTMHKHVKGAAIVIVVVLLIIIIIVMVAGFVHLNKRKKDPSATYPNPIYYNNKSKLDTCNTSSLNQLTIMLFLSFVMI